MSQLGTERNPGSAERRARTGPARRTRQPGEQKTHAAAARARHLAAAEQAHRGFDVETAMPHLGTSARRPAIARALLVADVVALSIAYAVALPAGIGSTSTALKVEMLALVLLGGTLLANAYGLYARDDRQVNHTTADDLVPVLHVMLIVTWVAALAMWLGTRSVNFAAMSVFLLVTLAVVPAA